MRDRKGSHLASLELRLLAHFRELRRELPVLLLQRATPLFKPLDGAGEVRQHGIGHEVEAVLALNGREVTLRKVYSEKGVKPHGRPTAEFSGHETQHYADGVPISKREDELLRIAARGDRAQQLLDAHEDEAYRQHAEDVGIVREVLVEEMSPMNAEEALHRAHAEFLGIRP